MTSISLADSVRLHEFLAKGPDFTPAIITGLTAISVALVVALITQRREDKRWLGAFFFGRRLDALSAFWIAVAHWHDVLVERRDQLNAGNTPTDEPIPPLESACLRALRVVEPFIEKSEFTPFKELTNRLLLVRLQVLPSQSATTETMHKREWDALDDAYGKAVVQMRDLLGLKVVKRIMTKAR